MDEGLTAGTRVLVRGQRWTVAGTTAFKDCAAVQLHGCENGSDVPRTLLTPFDRLQRIDPPSGVNVLRPRPWLRAVRRVAAGTHPLGGLRTAAASRVEILPYQLAPALAVNGGAARVMIADAVGLGKTIQAGLILSELAARPLRGSVFRALVAAPAGLREQWVRELAGHFSLPSTIAGAAWLTQMSRDLPADVNPWILPAIYITSFDFLKRPEVLRPLEEVTWDVLIVDEAHNASLGTARRAAIHDIGLRSRHVILLTATPHAGDAPQYDALCRIGEADPAEPLVIFRRSRYDTGIARARRSVLLPVRLSPAEQRMHRLLDDYTARVCREAGARGDRRARLAAIVLRKRALSSAASLAASAGKRLNLLAGSAPAPERQLHLPLGDEDDLPDEEPDAVLAAPGLSDTAAERRLLRRIADAAHAAADHESKTRALVRLLTRAREPAIVFTEYRDTLARLQRTLAAAGLVSTAIHGAQPPAERAGIQREFNDRGRLLLATDAAAEGLNLQARCRMVIHYELPWSPARIEQRTGRVDRIGQHRRVHEILLVARDTAERLVLAPLARRAARARAAIPGASQVLALLTESRVTAAVMDGAPIEASDDLPSPAASTATASGREAEAEAARLGLVREWMCPPEARAADGMKAGPLVTVMKRMPARSGATCIFRLSVVSPDGQVEHAELIALRDSAARPPSSSSAAASRRALEDWRRFREPHVRRAVESMTSRSIADAIARHERTVASLARREEALARSRPSAAQQLVQAGLFDGRVVRAYQAQIRSTGALLEESGQRQASLGTLRHVAPSIEFVALLWHRGTRQGHRS